MDSCISTTSATTCLPSSAVSGPSTSSNAQLLSECCCLVCASKPVGYHAGAIVCGSCYNFYRRYCRMIFNKSIEIKPPCQPQCLFLPDLRNYCMPCRWKKCCDIGMSSILIDPTNNDEQSEREFDSMKSCDFDEMLKKIRSLFSSLLLSTKTNELVSNFTMENLIEFTQVVMCAHQECCMILDIERSIDNFDLNCLSFLFLYIILCKREYFIEHDALLLEFQKTGEQPDYCKVPPIFKEISQELCRTVNFESFIVKWNEVWPFLLTDNKNEQTELRKFSRAHWKSGEFSNISQKDYYMQQCFGVMDVGPMMKLSQFLPFVLLMLPNAINDGNMINEKKDQIIMMRIEKLLGQIAPKQSIKLQIGKLIQFRQSANSSLLCSHVTRILYHLHVQKEVNKYLINQFSSSNNSSINQYLLTLSMNVDILKANENITDEEGRKLSSFIRKAATSNSFERHLNRVKLFQKVRDETNTNMPRRTEVVTDEESIRKLDSIIETAVVEELGLQQSDSKELQGAIKGMIDDQKEKVARNGKEIISRFICTYPDTNHLWYFEVIDNSYAQLNNWLMKQQTTDN
ncbi:hypothetical protein SNEBB_010708 [Seison nebaliae]|nr:hypothetical protein SNEBB_010708 [Seison nebaliae]